MDQVKLVYIKPARIRGRSKIYHQSMFNICKLKIVKLQDERWIMLVFNSFIDLENFQTTQEVKPKKKFKHTQE